MMVDFDPCPLENELLYAGVRVENTVPNNRKRGRHDPRTLCMDIASVILNSTSQNLQASESGFVMDEIEEPN